MATEMAFVEFHGQLVPDRMSPGTLFPFRTAIPNTDPPSLRCPYGHENNPFYGVFSCPRCGAYCLASRWHIFGFRSMICESSDCSAEWSLCMQGEGDDLEIIIKFRRSM